MKLLAIDPGDRLSAFVVYDTEERRPIEWWDIENTNVLETLDVIEADELAIEMIASYGMPVGREVFETCLWIGRFIERWMHRDNVRPFPRLVYRGDVKLHLCQSRRANDGNVRQALIDIFGPGKDAAIGRKATPGPLYGLTGDCWAALGVAVTAAETEDASVSTSEQAKHHIAEIREEHHV